MSAHYDLSILSELRGLNAAHRQMAMALDRIALCFDRIAQALEAKKEITTHAESTEPAADQYPSHYFPPKGRAKRIAGSARRNR